jgi:hypothetical protein
LLDILPEDAVKDEDLAAAGGINGKTRIGCDQACRAAKSLGDEVEARVAGLERRSNADGCIRLLLGVRFAGNMEHKTGAYTYQL